MEEKSFTWVIGISIGGILSAVLFFAIAYFLLAPLLLKILKPVFGRFPSLLASRYLFSRKGFNAINLITMISIAGIMIVSFALITVLSVFNGFHSLIDNRYGSFDPDIRILPKSGRTFAHSEALMDKAKKTEGVNYVCPVIENKAIITYGDKQQLVTVKGVPQDYLKIKRLDELVYEGNYRFESGNGISETVLGGTVAYYLSASRKDRVNHSTIWAALDGTDPIKDKEKAIDSAEVFVSGYFKTEMEYDDHYILLDFKKAEKLFHYQGLITHYDLRLEPGVNALTIKKEIEEKFGNDFQVLNSYDQHKTLFDVMRNEKWIAYLILVLMLVITGVNIIGSLSMVIVEKTRDIAILRSMGATTSEIRRAFQLEGLLVGAMGGLGGMAAAFLFGIIQETKGIVPLNGGESFGNIEYFPHRMEPGDFILIFATVFLFSFLAALYPAGRAAKAGIIQGIRK